MIEYIGIGDYIIAGLLLAAAIAFNVWARYADKRDGYR